MKDNLNEIVTPLLQWYEKEARILPWREYPSGYRVWVSEIMLQQTRVEAVKPYFQRFLTRLPDIQSLAEAPEDTLLKLWEGLGYYNRVRNLQKAAQVVMTEYGGILPQDYHLLLKLPGIGEYTAGAISSIAFGLPYPAVDGNVVRVITRLIGEERICTQTKVKKEITQRVAELIPKEQAGSFNQALMELGASICLPNGMPLCQKCPIRWQCYAFATNQVLKFPVKEAKKERKKENLWIFFLVFEGKIALRKRTQTGLLRGLWEFPNAPQSDESSVFQNLSTFGIVRASVESLGKGKHIFTHVQWDMEGFFVEIQEMIPEGKEIVWASPEELQQEYAIPTAFKLYLQKGIQRMKLQ